MTRQELTAYIESILPADREAMDAARQRQTELAKPPGSLGALEDMSIRLAGIRRTPRPRIDRCRVTVLAADNGVVAEGVSCAPQSVTVQQAVNMTRHKTGMSALAAYFGDQVQVVDVGICVPVSCPQVLDRKVRFSTGDIAAEPAMTEQEALRALSVGLDLAHMAKEEGIDAVGVGEMGIGNTTTSAAVLAALTGEPVPAREDIEAKKQIILRHGLALWDTLERCTITGAADASIKDAVPNDIAALLAKAPIEAVFCNGATAYRIYTKYLQPVSGIAAVKLPSTSPANAACRPEKLREIWGAALLPWINK